MRSELWNTSCFLRRPRVCQVETTELSKSSTLTRMIYDHALFFFALMTDIMGTRKEERESMLSETEIAMRL